MRDEPQTTSGLTPYVWGSLLLESARPNHRQIRLLGRVLGSIGAGAVPCGSSNEIGVALVVVRELARLQQDLSTGMGAWDHLSTRIAYLRLAGQSRWFVGPQDDPPYPGLVSRVLDPAGASAFTKEVLGDLAAIREDTVGLRQLADVAGLASPEMASGEALPADTVATTDETTVPATAPEVVDQARAPAAADQASAPEAAEPASAGAGPEESEEPAEEAPAETADDTTEEAPADTADDTTEEAPADTADETIDEVSDEASDEVSDQDVDEPEDELDLPALLELDALCTAFEVMARTQRPPDAQAWLDEHADLWWLPGAPPALAGVLDDVAAAIGLAAPTVDPSMGALRAIAGVTAWLVDVACAYPAPSHELPDDAPTFEPVERFRASLRGLSRLEPEEAVSLRQHVLDGRRGAAEEMLAAAMETAYPSSTEVYQHWVKELQTLIATDEWDSPLFRLRLASIRARLDDYPVRGPQALMHAGVPVHAMVQGLGMIGLTQVEETSVVDALRRALVEHRFDMEVFDLVHGTGVYRCPYARSTTCPGMRPICVSGITHLRDLPSEDVCEARASLTAAKWDLPPAATVGPGPSSTPRPRRLLPFRRSSSD